MRGEIFQMQWYIQHIPYSYIKQHIKLSCQYLSLLTSASEYI